MQDVEGAPTEAHSFGVGITLRPMLVIDISSDVGHGRNLLEPSDHVRAADIAGMHDMRHPSEILLGLGS